MARGAVPPAPAAVLAAAVLAVLALSGCSGEAAPQAPADARPAGMTIVGLVQDEAFTPVQGATATVRLTNLTATTDAGGLFRFEGLALGAYVVDVAAAGFEAATLTAEPRENASLTFVLSPVLGVLQETEVVHFTGILRCALEAAIISPSCDTLVQEVGGPDVFEDIATFEMPLRRDWLTAVTDVDFDPESSPGLAGLRMTVRGRGDANMVNEYEQYGRFYDATPFTVRLEPGAAYEDGTAPVPANTTYFQFEVYPHSHGYHPAGQGLLGVGAGVDVTFDLYVTVFYGLPAPDGYTLMG